MGISKRGVQCPKCKRYMTEFMIQQSLFEEGMADIDIKECQDGEEFEVQCPECREWFLIECTHTVHFSSVDGGGCALP